MDILHFLPENVNDLPDKPGVYKFYSSSNKLIYVGKAKSLKKRVSSYFHGSATKSGKTKRLVSEIKKIEITIVNTEFDAFLLENSLIKKHQPKYNILLKDDKTFPFICVTNERFPRIISTRKVIPGSGQYFGPYANVKAMKSVLELIRNIYYIRTCTFNLSKSNIENKKFKVCLEYHIGKCKGPCEGFQEEKEYNQEIDHAVHILKGNLKPVKDYFNASMMGHAEKMEFEKAETDKQRLELLEKFQVKTVVVSSNFIDTDVFSIIGSDKSCFINFLKINNGAIIHTQTLEVKKKLDETDEEILAMIIVEFRDKYQSKAREILTNLEVTGEVGATVMVPKIGDKRKLVELSLKNVLYFKKERFQRKQELGQQFNKNILKLQEDLRLKTPPVHIECFDNSNIQGTNPVAAMVCFRNGKPSKKDYRRFNIKTVTGANDFASMEEIIYRRYKRMLDEKQDLPELIIIDGGKGQLSSAINSLKKLDIYGIVPIIGIAKKLEEIYYPEDELPLHIDKRSPSLKFIQKIRDETHRFAITFHRQKRDKNTLIGSLDKIKGIGEQTKTKLLQKYKSPARILNTPREEIAKLIGKHKTEILFSQIKKEVR